MHSHETHARSPIPPNLLALCLPLLLLGLRASVGEAGRAIPFSLLFVASTLVSSFIGEPRIVVASLLVTAACSAYLPGSRTGLVFSGDPPGIAEWGVLLLTSIAGAMSARTLRRRLHADERTLASLALLRETAQISHVGGWEMDVRTKKHVWSDEVYRIYGVDRVAVEPSFDVMARMTLPEDRRSLRAHLESTLRSRRFDEFECRILRPDGVIRKVRVSGTVVTDARGEPCLVRGTVQDITERSAMEAALRESEERFAGLFHSNPLPFAVTDPASGVFLDANTQFLELYGYSREELLGRTSRELGIWQSWDQREAVVAELRRTESLKGVPAKFVTRAGRVMSALWWAERVSLAGREVILSCSIDVTERERAEQELRRSEERYELVAAASGMMFYDLCPDQGRTRWSRSTEQVLGIAAPPEGWPLERFWEMIHPDDRERTVAELMSFRDRAGSFDLEYRFRHADGHYLLVRNRGFSIREGPPGETHLTANLTTHLTTHLATHLTTHLIGVAEDVTEHRRSEERLRLLGHTVESITEAVTLIDLDEKVSFVNQPFVDTYGYRPEEIVGKGVGVLWSPRNPPSLLEDLDAMARRGSWRGEAFGLTKNQREFPVHLSVSRIRDEESRVIGYAVIHEDITERRQLEAQLVQSQKMEAVGRLAGGVAHDFNNTIGVILGFASLIEEKIDAGSPIHDDLQEILSAARRSANLTKQLLAFARRQVVAPVPLDLNQALLSLQKMLARLVGEDITIKMHTQEGLWTVKIDPTQVDQVLANLATNARDAIENVGSILIETSNAVIDASHASEHIEASAGEYVVLSFSDTGRGMDAVTRARVFEPFFTTKPKERGTGLGLAMVFGIVRQNNGFISVYSEVGHGTTFKLFFPRHYGEAEKPQEPERPQSMVGHGTVLIVEDEEQLLELGRRALEKSGYTVLALRSPSEAIALCSRAEQPIDLLVTDVVMPEMNGKELATRLLALRPDLKTVYMSGYPADVVAERGILDEGIHFVQKPFSPTDLARVVRRVLET